MRPLALTATAAAIPASRRRFERGARFAHGSAGGLSRRDFDVVRWVSEQYAVRLDQLAVLLGLSVRSARRTVERLAAAGLVERRRWLVDEPFWLWVTPRGQQVAGNGFRVWEPRIGGLAHIAAVNDVRLHVQAHAPDSIWVCERTLARDRRGTEHLPDAVVLTASEEHAIEVELTVKSARRIDEILASLCSRYDAVVYFAAEAVSRRLASLDAQGRYPKLVVRDLPRPTAQTAPRAT
jgi:DNA-binding MarR family transcriptional regulator